MGSFGYISNIALFFYIFMLLMLLAAKKNRVAISFIVLLISMICWTGGSSLMRAMAAPGYQVWYHVSLFGILLLPFGYYQLVTEFAGVSDVRVKIFYFVAFMLCFLWNIPNGFLLAPPEVVTNGAQIQFVYKTNWHIIFLVLFIGIVFIHLCYTFYKCWHEDESMQKQLMPVLWGIIVLCLGQLLVLSPLFKGFPIDIISGVLNALLIFYVLTRCQIIQLELTGSDNICYEMGMLLSFILHVSFYPQISSILDGKFADISKYHSLIWLVSFLLTTIIFVVIWKFLVKNFFIKKEIQRAEYMQNFSNIASNTLAVKEILNALLRLIENVTDGKAVYICETKGERGVFRISYTNREIERLFFRIEKRHPLIKMVEKSKSGVTIKDLYKSEFADRIKETEKELFEKWNIEAGVGLWNKDELKSVILIGSDKGKKGLDREEFRLICSASSVASMALNRASLYENAYYEARTDALTGLLNRKSFQEFLNIEFEKQNGRPIALILFNIDDFKLFNQLYGTGQGDKVLQKVACIIWDCVRNKGYVARYSGKEFAVLLPEYDVYRANQLAKDICAKIHDLNQESDVIKMKNLTVSVGISTTPNAAKTVKELLDNADMAVYHVKHHGKNGIQVFDTIEDTNKKADKKSLYQQGVYQEYKDTIYALTAAIDAKDHYTFSHSNNVAYYAMELAKELQLNEDVVEMIHQAGLLHDVGKISISESILGKPGRLTSDEYEIIKGHVEASINIIRHLPSLDYVIPAVIGHHERYDGKGYPRRIAGEDIPLSARILCIADFFDAMTSERVYKKAAPVEEVLKIMREEKGKQFDPDLVEVFAKCVEEGKIHVVSFYVA